MSSWTANAQQPGMRRKAMMPEPMMAPTPMEGSSEPGPLLGLAACLMVVTALTTISGAAEPNAMNVAPATSSRTCNLSQTWDR